MATQVYVGGTFNGWTLQPMSLSGGSNWTYTTSLTNGFHQYKFHVQYSGSNVWKLDPDNPVFCYDDAINFNTNSVAVIDPYKLLKSVTLSDGRTTTFDYDWVAGVGLVHIKLTRASYGDGNYASYTYYHPSNDLWRRPLMKTADDPHYAGPARSVIYSYQTNQAYSGQVFEERHLTSSQLLARLEINPDNPDERRVVDSDGHVTWYGWTNGLLHTNAVGYSTRAELYPFGGPIERWIDEKARTTYYGRTFEFGAVTTIWSSVRGTRSYTYTDNNYPVYLASMVDEAGRTSRYYRDSFQRVTNWAYPDGTAESAAYNSFGQIVVATRKDGSIVSNTYDGRGLLVARTDESGAVTRYGYDVLGRLASETNAVGGVTRYAYNWRGLVTNVVYTDGSEERLWYDNYGQLTQRQERAGGITVQRYDLYGRMAEQVDSSGATNKYQHDLEGRLLVMTTPLGLSISNTYDAIGRKIRETYSSDGTYNEWHYDPDGVRTQVNRMGGVTTFSYSPEGWLQRVTDPLGRTTSHGYDLAGNRTRTTNALADVMEYTYDKLDRQTSMRDCAGATVSNVYDAVGRLIRQIDANGIVTSNAYDAVGRLLASWRGGLLVVSNSYNAVGWVLARRDASGLTSSNTYDVAGRVLRSYMPDGSSFENVYSNTFLVQSTDRAGRSTRYQRDVVGRVTNQLDNATNSVRYGYDVAGNLTDLYDQNGSRTRFLFDAEGRQIGKVYADGVTNHYGYDALGRLISKLDGKGVSTAYRYDAVGNLTNIDYATDADVFFSYDPLNRMTRMVDGVGTTLYAYAGSCGQVQAVDGPFAGDTVSYGYDTGKRLVAVTSSSSVVYYTYDALDRFTHVIARVGTNAATTNTYAYVNNGRLPDALTHGNGVLTDYAYDPLLRLTNLIHQTGGTNLASFAYTYNAADLRTRVVRGGSGTTPTAINYSYDPIGQLTVAQGDFPGYNFDYAFDPAGNPIRQNNNGFVLSNAFNNLNQNTTSQWSGVLAVLGLANETMGTVTVNGVVAALRDAPSPLGAYFAVTNLPVAAGTNIFVALHTDPLGRTATSAVSAIALNSGYGYDSNGNLTNDGRFVYVWDNADRLKEVRTLDNSLVMSNLYDGLGRRRERVVAAGAEGGSSTNRYIYHDWAVVEIRDGGNNVIETYTHGPDLSGTLGGAGGIGGILSCSTSATSTVYYHYDANGNVIACTDADGALVTHLEYSPFGKVMLNSGSYVPRYQFSSKEFDAAVGLNYYGFRFYSPQTGRWLSRDPLSEHAFVSHYRSQASEEERLRLAEFLRQGEYRFLDNNALTRIDPQGLQFYEPPLDSELPEDHLKQWMDQCRSCAEKAKANAQNKYPWKEGEESKGHDNCMRHCLGSADIANQCGQACAFAAGHGYEWEGGHYFSGDSKIDRENNAKGRGCAGAADREACCKGKCPPKCEAGNK